MLVLAAVIHQERKNRIMPASWVHWYNATRLHTSIADVPPVEYEEDYHRRTARSPGSYSQTAVA